MAQVKTDNRPTMLLDLPDMTTENVWFNPDFAQTESPTAVFADRDGTLIEHVDYIDHPDKLVLLPGVKESVRRLLDRGIPFFILTNQSGVGRGYFPIEQVHACQKRLFELLEIQPEEIAGWCIAPEAPGTEGGYRKPSPRFLSEACQHMNLKPENCHVIGDTLVDLQTAWASKAKAWAVGCGKKQLPESIRKREVEEPHEFRESFEDCVELILKSAH